MLISLALGAQTQTPPPPGAYRSPWTTGYLMSRPNEFHLRPSPAKIELQQQRLLRDRSQQPVIESCAGNNDTTPCGWRQGFAYYYLLTDPSKAPIKSSAGKILTTRGDVEHIGHAWADVEQAGRCKCDGVCSKSSDPTSGGFYAHKCEAGSWVQTSLCLERDKSYAMIAMGMGFEHIHWNYTKFGLKAWSYYIRAFDINREMPVQEVGWGQWSKPAAPDGSVKRCGLRPHGFTCADPGTPPIDFNEQDSKGNQLHNCGKLDWQSQEQCSFHCCNKDNNQCGVTGTIEGGMGYWMYGLETKHVKWMLPGSTVGNYESFGGTFLGDRPQPCTNLGGAVRISNRLLVPNDHVAFQPSVNGSVDGFMGYMLARTGLGKRSATDHASSWTIVIDAANFAGPAMFVSSWFWDKTSNWHPESTSWSDPRFGIGYIAQGFERGVGAKVLYDETSGETYYRITKLAIPQDRKTDHSRTFAGSNNASFTLFTGHSQYPTDGIYNAVENLLDNDGATQAQLTAAIKASRVKPTCGTARGGSLGMELQGASAADGSVTWEAGLGVGPGTDYGSDNASCAMRLLLNTSELRCEGSWCEVKRFLKRDSSGRTSVLDATDVPADIRNVFALQTFDSSHRKRRYGPPQQTERPCFEMPGPASDDLFCTRTESGVWIGYKWYRFVDQPELNQVFASLPANERDAAKCYMQARITRLHKAQRLHAASEGTPPRWFDAPQGPEQLPQGKVSIDPALLVTPPTNALRDGYVPVPIIEMRVKPQNCTVVSGCFSASDKDPANTGTAAGALPFAVGAVTWEYTQEICPATTESDNKQFSALGTVFPLPPGADYTSLANRVSHGYAIPNRTLVQNGLSATAAVCPIDPSGASGNSNSNGGSGVASTCSMSRSDNTTNSTCAVGGPPLWSKSPTSAPTTSSATDSSSSSSSSSWKGISIGTGVVVPVLLVAACSAGVLLYMKCRSPSSSEDDEEDDTEADRPASVDQGVKQVVSEKRRKLVI